MSYSFSVPHPLVAGTFQTQLHHLITYELLRCQQIAGMLRSMVRHMKQGLDRRLARCFHLGAGVQPPISLGSAPAQCMGLAVTTRRHYGLPGCYSDGSRLGF